uniref:PR5-like receptor kinase n=1 Tax=Erigeron canadensis TaxID=72917 RepID=UPI001CB91464|nr:PR5-like receptor kinase [Erigeron canadensis]
MQDCNPLSTLVDTADKLGAHAGVPFDDPTLYRSLAGALQPLTFTRPDISYVVQQVCMHMHAPHNDHFIALKRILRYVKGTLDMGIWMRSSSLSTLIAYTDADLAGCPDTRRSTSGYCFSCGAIAGIFLLLLVKLCQKKRLWETREYANHEVEIFIKNYRTLALKRFNYSEIKRITNSFVEILGKGAFGSVYKGQLPDGQLVAVKLLAETQGDGEDFINEVASIGRTSHVNIVTLLGFCIEGKKRALMYEFMPNGSLDKFLCRDSSHLDCNTLFQIAKGIARGLEYLHRGCNTRIVHFDIKPHNILLDEEFIPKISDFGLAKLCKTKESIVSVMGARGTAGYMAPEVFFKYLGGASHKSDVYSFGMMVLEMTGARKNNKVSATSTSSEAYFPDWVYMQIESGSNLGDNGRVTTEYEEELVKKLMIVGLWCIQSDPSDRPPISKVVEMLEGSIELLQVPPRRFWSSPSRPAQHTSPSATQSSSGEILSRE